MSVGSGGVFSLDELIQGKPVLRPLPGADSKDQDGGGSLDGGIGAQGDRREEHPRDQEQENGSEQNGPQTSSPLKARACSTHFRVSNSRVPEASASIQTQIYSMRSVCPDALPLIGFQAGTTARKARAWLQFLSAMTLIRSVDVCTLMVRSVRPACGEARWGWNFQAESL